MYKNMQSIRNLEIMKAALEGDLMRQRESINKDKPEFKEWLRDTQSLLIHVRRLLNVELTKQSLRKQTGHPK